MQYAALFGREPGAESDAKQAYFQLDNVAVRLVASDAAEGIRQVVFATPDLGKARHVLGRRGIPLDDDARLDATVTYGVSIALIERSAKIEADTTGVRGAIGGLDHIVIATPNPDRAAALYGARLGLEMKLDRSNADWGSRLMFFKCGDLIVEIAHDLNKGVGEGPDRAWGLSWRTADLHGAHVRLSNAGVNVSEIRVGRKPGTQVFTVRDHTAGVPTIVIGKT